MRDTAQAERARLQFGLIFLAHALGAMSVLSVLTAGPRLVTELGLTALQLGGLASVYSAALAGASLPAGLVTDRLGTRAALSLAALIIAVGLMVSAAASGVLQLGAGMALCGAGYGLINPAAGVAITLWFRPKWRATLLSLKQAGVPVGAALGSLTALLGPVWGWQAGILSAAMIALSASLLFHLLLPKATTRLPRDTADRNSLAKVLTLPGLGRANLAAGLTNGMQFALWAHIPDLLQRTSEAGAVALGTGLAALHLGTFVGRIVWGALTDRLFRGNAAYALWWLCLLGLTGVAVLGASTLIAGPAATVVACFVLGFTVCSAVGLHAALTAQIAPHDALGQALGYTMLVTNIGGIVVPVLLGLVVVYAGMAGGTLTLGVLMATALALLTRFR